MSNLHAREQVLDYIVALITESVLQNCVKHRKGPREQYKQKHIEVTIKDETIDGDDGGDEVESTLGTLARVAPLLVTITVKDAAKAPEADAANLCGYVEQALATEDGTGDHNIGGALVSIQYAAMATEDDDTLEADMCQSVMIFQASYRTPIGQPFTLI